MLGALISREIYKFDGIFLSSDIMSCSVNRAKATLSKFIAHLVIRHENFVAKIKELKAPYLCPKNK